MIATIWRVKAVFEDTTRRTVETFRLTREAARRVAKKYQGQGADEVTTWRDTINIEDELDELTEGIP